MAIQQHRNYINGKFVDRANADMIPVLNPSTEKVISEVPDSSAEVVNDAVAAAKAAQDEWRKLPAIQRANYLRQISAKIRENVPALAKALTEEQGKVQTLSEVEIAFTADYIDYMAEWARRIEGEIINSDRPGENIFLFRQPVGVVAGILPWNFPFFLIARKLGPALVTGNTLVLKPSTDTPNNAAMFVDLLDQTDVPKGVINVVYGRGSTTGNALCDNPDVGLVSFTGSVEIGSRIMGACAKNITKVNLELGGKAPAIVMADADIDKTVAAVKASRVINTGQACNCAERVYIDRRVEDEFITKFSKAMSETKYNDPGKVRDLDMGPMINKAAQKTVDDMVKRAVKDGAELVTGGSMSDVDGKGYFFQPTVLRNCEQSSEIMQEEVFGPVMPINTFDSLDEAIQRANDSKYGLTSSIYTRDIGTAMRACNDLKFGETYINREHFEAMQGFHAGVRQSGIGGADGKHGLYENTETHVVYLQS
ncbi:MAG: aldehyde dehydrogenase [Alphaproteobacteria bacterium]|nr:aldehyde dehydrogenase [Alphaproteobacteria bacterium]